MKCMANLETSLKSKGKYFHQTNPKTGSMFGQLICFVLLKPWIESDPHSNRDIILIIFSVPLYTDMKPTYLIPLRCIILMIMVALMKNNMKKSTISAMNLWRGEGIRYSRPGEENSSLSQGHTNCQKYLDIQTLDINVSISILMWVKRSSPHLMSVV